MATTVRTVPIGAERFSTDDDDRGPLPVRRPRDRPGARRAAEPTSSGRSTPRPRPGAAVRCRVAAGRDPRPRRAPARRAGRGVRPDDRRRGGEADQDRAGRGPARRVDVHVRGRRGPALAGEMVPMDAADAGEGKLAFTLRVPIGVVGAISPFNFPLNLVAHKVAPAIAAGCPVVLKPASQTPLSAITLAELLLDECGLPARPPERRDRRRRHRRQRARRPPRRRDDHVHRLARRRVGHPGAGRRARRSGSSSATTRR